MKKILYYLRENLEITTREARSTLAFLATATLCTGIYITISFLTRSHHARYTVEKYATETPSLPKEEPPVLKKAKFRFDPNLAGHEQLTDLGIPPRTADHILNYRKKGGKFRYREDLRKIYTLKPEVYAGLEDWIDLPAKNGTLESKPVKEKMTKTERIAPFDINTADTTALKKLKGIGSVLAARIIRFRDALGGFHSPDQLDETYGIPPEVLLTLKKAVVIGSPVKLIQVNETGTFKHPYIRPYQVKALLAYRQQHGPFRSPDDLYKIKVLDEETLQKLKPYLSF